ncbi:MAG: hypothetical protein ABEK59_13025 [Halobacteria archaeon]
MVKIDVPEEHLDEFKLLAEVCQHGTSRPLKEAVALALERGYSKKNRLNDPFIEFNYGYFLREVALTLLDAGRRDLFRNINQINQIKLDTAVPRAGEIDEVLSETLTEQGLKTVYALTDDLLENGVLLRGMLEGARDKLTDHVSNFLSSRGELK